MTALEIITYFVIAGLIVLGLMYIAAALTSEEEDDYDWWNDV